MKCTPKKVNLPLEMCSSMEEENSGTNGYLEMTSTAQKEIIYSPPFSGDSSDHKIQQMGELHCGTGGNTLALVNRCLKAIAVAPLISYLF